MFGAISEYEIIGFKFFSGGCSHVEFSHFFLEIINLMAEQIKLDQFVFVLDWAPSHREIRNFG